MGEGSVIDLNHAYAALAASRGVERPYEKALCRVPPDLLAFIEEGEDGLEAAKEAVSFVEDGNGEGPKGEKLLLRSGDARLRAPLPSLASRIAMAGANFYDHSADVARMFGRKVTAEDIRRQVEAGEYEAWGFWKFARNVAGPDEPIVYPSRTQRLDYEVEVAAVIGRRCKDVGEEEAMEHVYGYTIVNDVSARDQPGDRGFFLAKNFDTSAPMGPCLVTADEIGDPHSLRMGLKVNGVTRQDGSMGSMIRRFTWWISFLSRDFTLYPGDIICGGTCSGTALDTSPRDEKGGTKPDRFVKAGDVLEAWVEKIGTLRNPIVAKK